MPKTIPPRKWNPQLARYLHAMENHHRFPRTTQFVFQSEDEILIAAEEIKKRENKYEKRRIAEANGRIRPVKGIWD